MNSRPEITAMLSLSIQRHICPIPVEVKCQYGFRENGCKKCLLKHTELLDKPRED